MKAEPGLQQRFSILAALLAIALGGVVLLAHELFLAIPDREELGRRQVRLRFEPARLDAQAFAPLRLVGAWTVSSDDPRLGGVSGLALDGDSLVALTDSGAVIRFPKAIASTVEATIRELPDGPGDPRFKKNRDSEALSRDPEGFGWWVTFETRDELWLYDRDFARPLRRLQILPRGLGLNTGVEGLAASGEQLFLFPEVGKFAHRLNTAGWSSFDLPVRRLSEAAALPDGSVLVVERRLSFTGFVNVLAWVQRCASGYCVGRRIPLAVGPLDNIEALAAEPLESGATRLWIATDDNWHPRMRTLLIAADLPPPGRA